jgi:hypothetical protein
MFMTTILSLACAAATGAALDPCDGVTAPAITIHQIHAAPIEIAVAWHVPPTGSGTLHPPLEAIGERCDGQHQHGPGLLRSGDTISRGTLSNLGDSTIHLLTTDGELLRIPGGQSMWVGQAGGLTPTHRCMCVCTCSGPGFSATIITRCNALGGCGRHGETCELIGPHGKIRTGTLSECVVVYSPIPSPVVL